MAPSPPTGFARFSSHRVSPPALTRREGAMEFQILSDLSLSEEESQALETFLGKNYCQSEEAIGRMNRVVQAPLRNLPTCSGFLYDYDHHMQAYESLAFQSYQMQVVAKRRWDAEKEHLTDTMTYCSQQVREANSKCSALELQLGELKGEYAEMKRSRDHSHQEMQSMRQELLYIKEELISARQHRIDMEARLVHAQSRLANADSKLSKLQTEVTRLEDLGNHPEEWQQTYSETPAYEKVLGVEMAGMMTDLHFYNKSKNIAVDFTQTFHPALVPNFDEDYPARAEAADKGEYLSD